VNPHWWNNALMVRDLPGGPLQVTYDSGHRPGISRGALFGLAAMTESSDGVLQLLVNGRPAPGATGLSES
jgi:hypothetical protein